MRTILIPTKLNKAVADILKQNAFTVIQDATTPLAELVSRHPEAIGMIVRSEKITPEVIDALPKLKLIVRAGAGYDTIDIKHARRRNVDVMNTPGANSNAVAEEVVTLILAAYRHVPKADATTRAGQWEKNALMGSELTGKTVGIVGLGNIGQLLVKRLSGFEVKVIGYDPVLSASRAEQLGVELGSVADIFARADVVSLHVPETPETMGMVNRALLETMKPGAVLVNCARSGVINEDDLLAVTKERKLLYCADVFSVEGVGPKKIADACAVMMPHLGASTEEANLTAATRAAEQLVAYLERGVANFVVNRAVPPGLDPGYQMLAYFLSRVARACLGDGEQPTRIETSYYGDLDKYSNWLLGPVVLGLSSDFDPLFDYTEAETFLAEKGIQYEKRASDAAKGYGNSMTIDLMSGKSREFHRISVRGTIAEGLPMVSRINDFDRLYFDPRGHSLLCEYKDQPGMLAKIARVLGDLHINIEDVRAPQDLKTGHSLAVLKVNQCIAADVVASIKASLDAVRVVYLHIA